MSVQRIIVCGNQPAALSARQAQYRAELEKCFTDERKSEREEKHVSPSGRYWLRISNYSQGADRKEFTRGELFSPSGLLADVKRDDDLFWFTWISGKDNHEIFVCSEVGACQLVVDCTQQDVFLHLPDSSSGPPFLWQAVHPHPTDHSILAVEGRYPTSASEIKLVKLAAPSLPFQDLGTISDWYSEFIRWDSDDTIVIARDYEVRKSDGKLIDELTEKETAEYLAKHVLWHHMSQEEQKRRFPTWDELSDFLDTDNRQELEYWKIADKLRLPSFPHNLA